MKRTLSILVATLLVAGCGSRLPDAVPATSGVTSDVPSDDPAGRAFGISDAAALEACPLSTRAQFDIAVTLEISNLNRGWAPDQLIASDIDVCQDSVDVQQCIFCSLFRLTVANINR